LLDSVPQVATGRRRQRMRLAGGVGTQTTRPTGCPFADRCPKAESRCHAEMPELREIGPGHAASCHFA
jgi:oligopeptide/dipeptide ABC transporter ATP-binding protein